MLETAALAPCVAAGPQVAALGRVALCIPTWEARELPSSRQREGFLEGNGEGFVRINLSSQCSERKQCDHGVPVMLRSRD